MIQPKDLQLRGHCQCCGREQAVRNDTMAKHGYTVDHGFFNGVCPGASFVPMEESTEQTTQVIAEVHKEVARLRAYADDLEAGKRTPPTVQKHHRLAPIPFDEAPPHLQQLAIENEAHMARVRARGGERFVAHLEELAATVHGQPLREVTREKGPTPIVSGERRLSARGHVLVARYQQGGRVYWRREDGGGECWMGGQAWRRLRLVE